MKWRNLMRVVTPIAVFVVFVISISYKVLPSSGVLMYGDAPFIWPFGLYSGLSTWNENFLGLPWILGMFGFFSNNLATIFTTIGLNFQTAGYLQNYLPILLTCLAFFFITKKISGKTPFAYFAGFFIILNNFMLEQFIVWPGHYFWNVLGLGILFYCCWRISAHGFTLRLIAAIILSSLLQVHPLMWWLYMLLFVTFIVFHAIATKKVNVLAYGAAIVLGIIGVNSYWVIPFIANFATQSAAEAYSGNLESVFSGYKQVASYSNLLMLKQYPGFSLNDSSQHLVHNVGHFISMFGLYSIAAWMLVKRHRNRFVFFSIIVFLLFFNFALGPNSFITGKVFDWMFSHIPGFGYFRSFTRFLQISLIALIVFFAITVRNESSKKVRYGSLIGIILLFGTNMIFFSGNMSGTIGAATVPREYFDMNQKYFSDRTTARYKIMSYPNIPYESYTWSVNSNTTVFPQLSYFKQYFFSQPSVFNMYAVFLDRRKNYFSKIFAFQNKFIATPALYRHFDELNIRYLIVQKDQYNILERGTVDSSYYQRHFSNSPALELRETNQYFNLYENKDYLPTIFGPNTQFQQVYDTMYKVRISNIGRKMTLSLLQSFHPGWKLYALPVSGSWCRPAGSFPRVRTVECEHENSFLTGSPLNGLWRQTVFDSAHRVSRGYANGWDIDPETIRTTFPPGTFTMNNDGSLNLDLMIYFQPQSYFTLGILVSAITLAATFGVIIYGIIIDRRQKRRVKEIANAA